MQNKNICIVDIIDPNITIPGGSRSFTMNLLEYLIKEFNVILFGVGANKSEYNFKFVSVCNKSSQIRYIFNLFFMKKPTNSLVHVQSPLYILPFIFFKKNNFIISTLHGDNSKAIRRKKGRLISVIYDSIEKFALKQADKIIAVDNGTKYIYLKKHPWLQEKIVMAPVGVDIEKFKPIDKQKIRHKYKFNTDDKIILYVGRLRNDKGVDTLLKAFRQIEGVISNAKLVIVGDGKDAHRLMKLATEFALDNVFFLGTIEHDKIPEIMNCADVFALASLYESGPLVVQEALACGIPVVTTNVGRVQEFIRDDSIGRIVDRDEENFAMAIKEVLKMDQEITRKRCRQLSMDFSFEKTANTLIQIYKELERKDGK